MKPNHELVGASFTASNAYIKLVDFLPKINWNFSVAFLENITRSDSVRL